MPKKSNLGTNKYKFFGVSYGFMTWSEMVLALICFSLLVAIQLYFKTTIHWNGA